MDNQSGPFDWKRRVSPFRGSHAASRPYSAGWDGYRASLSKTDSDIPFFGYYVKWMSTFKNL